MAEEADRPVTPSDLVSLEGSIETRLEAIITADGEKMRRHMDAVFEVMRADLKRLIDVVSTTDEKVDRLVAHNAVERAAFVDAIADHEVRQRVLERILEPPATDNP